LNKPIDFRLHFELSYGDVTLGHVVTFHFHSLGVNQEKSIHFYVMYDNVNM